LIVADAAVDQRRDHQRAGVAKQQCIAIGIGLRDELCRDGAAGPRFVLDDHALPEQRRQSLRDQPRHDVGRSAWREADHDVDWLGRITLRQGAGRREAGQCSHGRHEYEGPQRDTHSILP
jgi:hypothetical protein